MGQSQGQREGNSPECAGIMPSLHWSVTSQQIPSFCKTKRFWGRREGRRREERGKEAEEEEGEGRREGERGEDEGGEEEGGEEEGGPPECAGMIPSLHWTVTSQQIPSFCSTRRFRVSFITCLVMWSLLPWVAVCVLWVLLPPVAVSDFLPCVTVLNLVEIVLFCSCSDAIFLAGGEWIR